MSATSHLGKVLKIFYSYARPDKKLRDELAKHLSGLQRQGLIAGWYDGEIIAGSERDTELKKYLKLSDIILLLISPDFVASDYCYCTEMDQALERHKRGEAYVIPILLRPTALKGLPFAFLQLLPPNGKPVTRSKDKDAAFLKITEALRNVIDEIGAKLPSEPAPPGRTQAASSYWKVPYPRNDFFIGRDSVLEQLHTTFLARKTGVVVQTLNGLGGIGKTQIALEYVYRYTQTYQAIFWVAADPQGDLLADFVSIAQFLQLPEKDEPDQGIIVEAIKQWFQQHEGWLLLFDNVEDITAVNAFRPSAGQGHILITTRAQATGTIATPCEVEPMDLQEGAQFLLRRAKRLPADLPLEQVENQERIAAGEISQLFGGHPLALDQAGAYVEETGQHLADYLDLYQHRHAALLSHRGDTSTDHPESVMMTFSLALESVERTRSDAAELLRFCAFLHPDALPEELLTAGALSFEPRHQRIAHDPFELNAALSVLRKYSLIKRNPATKTVSVHRLVQEVLKNSMEQEQQRQRAESVVRTLGRAFPDGEPASWPICQRYLPHARIGIQLLEFWQMRFVEAVQLLNRVGYYLYKRAEYVEAQLHFEHALKLLAEEEEPLLTAQILSNLGVVQLLLAHYPQAELSLKRALRLREQQLEPTHVELAQNLNELAGVYHNQGQLSRAEPLYQQALTIQEQALGMEDPATVRTLSNLALLNYSQKKYAEAEVVNKRVLAIREKQLGAKHVDTGRSLLNLAYVYYRQQRYTEADPLFRRALAIYQEAYGPEHPQTMIALNGLGLLYTALKRYDEAESLFQQILTRWEEAYGPQYPRIAGVLNAQATISLHKELPDEAESLLRRALQIWEQKSWLEELDFIASFKQTARVYERQEKYVQAEALYKLVITLLQRDRGEAHQEVATAQEEYTSFLHRRRGNSTNEDSNTG
ncbi:toll/interleukin-1 receptor domain-containing protein [Ktedonosporobacter rubrisoli]|uniref:Toll/interleukin-1 receptor domain-containing protein n=1 Tax=Ktedonosporobacter rubrisoli TaxID=2509675 RepID=A0A4P6JJD4_KTERU|nr:FxSxx-COOH system tetratricopeptide repeat protein [Ktedonosporobacter rubrisoli]QBD75032.1 toll/interleukin-1 receptor domain-containing protein [Ktedonosporobacter rubrisoli]